MAMFNRDNVVHVEMFDRAYGILDRAEKRRDPLAYYWGRGVQNMRETFSLTLEFQPKPEEVTRYGF